MIASLQSALRRHRKWWMSGAVVAAAGAAFVFTTNRAVLRAGRGRMYFDAEIVPARDVAIVLGTSPQVRGRWQNPFFESRMEAAAELWRQRKVRHFILSGDNGRRGYDEPTAMRAALLARRLPDSCMTLDYAGFRTLDTMARARAVFQQHEVMLVTDDFHLPRSLYLADAQGLDAIGFGGKPVPRQWSRRTRIREIASRSVAWLDVHILHRQPKFLGRSEPIRIVEAAVNVAR